jgi:hypothetical protein
MRHPIVPISILLGLLVSVLIPIDCTPEAKTVVSDVAVQITDTACKELLDPDSGGTDPLWVTLVCEGAAGVAGGLIKVILPRKQWEAMKGHTPSADAGPGK